MADYIANFRLAWLLPGCACLLWGCLACGARPPQGEEPVLSYEFRQLDTLVVAATRLQEPADEGIGLQPPYRASQTRHFDLLHTALDLHFDWEGERVIGTAILQLSPYFYPQDQLRLDAKGMDIHRVALPGGEALSYAYHDPELSIRLDRIYAAGQTATVVIDYTARPAVAGGARRIPSDGGIYFVKSSPDSAPHIWTQGETAFNSRWFPTLDQPNERATQEIRLTVADSLRTLSNGLLVTSRDNGNGTRTDHWQLDLPHAPYLAMVAVGDFALVEDSVQGLPLQYYVEKEHAVQAREIFPQTPEMVRFFGNYLGLAYPWPKYAQIAVRDFVAGAMENTTAVVFGDFMLDPERARQPLYYNERIVAHELVHHWFGNLVTCESWANLALNEGFASYGEYLWLENRYGRETADRLLASEKAGYFAEAERRQHPLIFFRYHDAEDLFDNHSYNKGSAVVHMLRHEVGEAAFRAGLKSYLNTHAFDAAEVHDLRQAFEAVTGRDLNWFFDQWFLQAGHPQLEIQATYLADSGELVLSVEQVQDTRLAPAVFLLPTELELVDSAGQKRRVELRIDRRKQQFRIPQASPPAKVILDPDNILLAEKKMLGTATLAPPHWDKDQPHETLAGPTFTGLPEKGLTMPHYLGIFPNCWFNQEFG